MINDIRVHPRHHRSAHDLTGNLKPTETKRTLPLICPHCQQAIQLASGLCGNRQIDAILLQAERIGTELHCGHCGLKFVFHRTGSTNGPRQFSLNKNPIFPSPPARMTQLSEQPMTMHSERV